jgi:hypothetical protein
MKAEIGIVPWPLADSKDVDPHDSIQIGTVARGTNEITPDRSPAVTQKDFGAMREDQCTGTECHE